MSTTPAYDALVAAFARQHRLDHLQQIAYWDQEALMPVGAAAARADALAEMATLLHGLRTDPALADQLARAEQEPLAAEQRANWREMRRAVRADQALPSELVTRRAQAHARSELVWRQARPRNDWAGFVPSLREVVALAREEAALRAAQTGLAPYDALMDGYEPGMTAAEVERVFTPLRQWLPGLIAEVQARQQAGAALVQPQGPFPTAAQHKLCERVMHLLAFNFEAGRLDVSAHPFSGGVPEDVRLTTRYDEADFLKSLMGTIHETGHGRYEQGLPRALLGQPVARARSMAIHESQSLAFEMQLARHPGFIAHLQPLLVAALGAQPAFELPNLLRLVHQVVPGHIRVDADEVTYPAHVVLRFEIERALIDGRMQVEDIPAAWDEGMQRWLGLDTRGDYRNGPMQDVHWAAGLIGYFPCYTLGAMYAAQWFATLRRQVPDLDARIAAGDLGVVFDWLRTHVWEVASRYETPELVQRISGEPLNPAYFEAHLRARYLSLS